MAAVFASCFFIVTLTLTLTCLLIFIEGGVTLDPILARQGQDVAFRWDLPAVAQDTVLVVAHEDPYDSVFIASTVSSHVFVTQRYENRVEVNDTNVNKGVLEFWLLGVTENDAGQYLCVKGLSHGDILPDCGQALVLVGKPHAPVVTEADCPLIGSSLTLRCDVISTSAPRNHSLPMRYRWFEMGDNGGWTELKPNGPTRKEEDANLHSFTDNPGTLDYGSGDEDTTDREGHLDVLHLGNVTRGDEGRQLACQASDGLDIWSDLSPRYTVLPEWAPSPSDMTLTPAVKSLPVSVGQSVSTTCSATCRPQCQVVWLKVSRDNLTLTALTREANLTLPRVREEEGGKYRCVASNQHGQAHKDWQLTVAMAMSYQERSDGSWLANRKHVIIVVVIVTVGVALGMVGTAYVVVRCRRRSTPVVWPHQRGHSDVVPLSAEYQPSRTNPVLFH